MDKLQILEHAFTELANAIHESNRLLDWSESRNSQGSDLATWSYYEFTRSKSVHPPLPEEQFKIDGHRMIAPPFPECEFGNYEPGRYGWILNQIQILERPFPAPTGFHRGLWTLKVTA